MVQLNILKKKLKFIPDKEGGLSYSRKLGSKISKGEFIFF